MSSTASSVEMHARDLAGGKPGDRGRIGGALTWKLAAIFALGALQGAMGWYMVQSGLVDNPRVSQYRLAAHLGMALLIYAAMLWIALDLIFPRGGGAHPGPRRW